MQKAKYIWLLRGSGLNLRFFTECGRRANHEQLGLSARQRPVELEIVSLAVAERGGRWPTGPVLGIRRLLLHARAGGEDHQRGCAWADGYT